MKKGRRADKEDRRSQKRKIIGERRETKKKQKTRTKRRKKLCSTSPPGGNQVDGLPPVVNTDPLVFQIQIVVPTFCNFYVFRFLLKLCDSRIHVPIEDQIRTRYGIMVRKG